MIGHLPLAVDTLGGDFGLRVSLPAALHALQVHPKLHLCLVGDADELRQQVARAGVDDLRLSIEHAPENIPMDASPASLLRGAGGSSMHAALKLLADGKVKGVVSAGNTGALMALGRQQVSMLPGYTRPAFCTALPGKRGDCYLLDLGANVDCSSGQLLEFARLGAGLLRALHECVAPTAALLSNGEEPGKGNDAVREAAVLLQQEPGLRFIGFVEADKLLDSPAQVIVCDGFTGNVALKAMEGVARFATNELRAAYNQGMYSRALAWLSRAQFKAFARGINAERHGGAFLLGLNGVVVKSHGASGVDGFSAAVGQAVACIEHDMVSGMARSH